MTAAGGGLGAILVQLAPRPARPWWPPPGAPPSSTGSATLGADVVVDYSTPDWTDRVWTRPGASTSSWTAPGVTTGAPRSTWSGRRPVLGARHSRGGFATADPEVGEARGITATGIEDVQFAPEQFRSYLVRALDEVAGGRIAPLIGQTFPLERAADAHAAIENRTAVGKTLLLI